MKASGFYPKLVEKPETQLIPELKYSPEIKNITYADVEKMANDDEFNSYLMIANFISRNQSLLDGSEPLYMLDCIDTIFNVQSKIQKMKDEKLSMNSKKR